MIKAIRKAMLGTGHLKKHIYISVVLVLNIIGFFYYLYFYIENGYLPSPFIYDKTNTFMDLFNPLHWAYDEGRYTEWNSVYPPLSFIVLRFLNFVFAGEGFGDPAIMRDSSQWVIMGVCFAYFALPALLVRQKYWRDFSNIEKKLFYFVMILSSPMLFTLERGNLILITPVLLALALSKVGLSRCIYIALLINIKPYFAVLMTYYIARKNWKGLATCITVSGLIFFIIGLILDDNFTVFFLNLFSFSNEENLFSLREVMTLPSSFSAFSYVLRHPDGAKFAANLLTPEIPEAITIFVYLLETAKWCLLGFSIISVLTTSKSIRDSEIFSLLIVFISNLGVWVGGYTFILYTALIPVLIRMRARWLYFILLSLIAMPLDIITLMRSSIGMQYSFLSSSNIEIFWTIGLGSFIRPIANFIFLFALSYEFIFLRNKNSNHNLRYFSSFG